MVISPSFPRDWLLELDQASPEDRALSNSTEEMQINKVLPGLYITSVLPAYAYGTAHYHGPPLTHMLWLLGPDPPIPAAENPHFPTAHLQHKFVPVSDHTHDDIAQHFAACVDFIRDALASSPSGNTKDDDTATIPSTVLVHCWKGKSRSATVMVAFLMRERGLRCDEALELLKRKRSFVDPNPGFRAQLRLWERCGFELWERDAGAGSVARKEEYQRCVDEMEIQREAHWQRKRERAAEVAGRDGTVRCAAGDAEGFYLSPWHRVGRRLGEVLRHEQLRLLE